MRTARSRSSLAAARKEALRTHYDVERELADRLRAASRDERLSLYNTLYDERLARIPSHPLLARARDPRAREAAAAARLRLLKPFLTPHTRFMEVGPGDGAVAMAVARHVRRVYAVDVSEVLLGAAPRPGNFSFHLTDGVTIPAPRASIDVAYSDQVIEHLHPADAEEHVRNVAAALTPRGRLICITPNRLSGPWDVSRDFDSHPTGLHLREYTIGELCELLERCGLRPRVFVAARGRHLSPFLPPRPVRAIESTLERLPRAWTRRAAEPLVALKVVATK